MGKQFTHIAPGKRKIEMYCAGTTMGVSNYPVYEMSGVHYQLPRPYSNNKVGKDGNKLLDTSWIQCLIRDIEKLSLHFIKSLPQGKQKSNTITYINKAYSTVPQELRLCGTFFTHMSVVGCMDPESSTYNESNAHVDEGDVFTAILNLCFPTVGGNTIFYDSYPTKKLGLDKTNPKIIHQFQFKHGHVHMGSFHSLVHAVQKCKGPRGSVILNLKSDVVDFFQTDNAHFYYQYQHNEQKKRK